MKNIDRLTRLFIGKIDIKGYKRTQFVGEMIFSFHVLPTSPGAFSKLPLELILQVSLRLNRG